MDSTWSGGLHAHAHHEFLPSGGGFRICKTIQEYASDTVISVLQERTKDPVTALWLIHFLNRSSSPGPTTIFWSPCVHILSVIIEQPFLTQERPGRLKRQAGDIMADLSREGPREPCLLTFVICVIYTET